MRCSWTMGRLQSNGILVETLGTAPERGRSPSAARLQDPRTRLHQKHLHPQGCCEPGLRRADPLRRRDSAARVATATQAGRLALRWGQCSVAAAIGFKNLRMARRADVGSRARKNYLGEAPAMLSVNSMTSETLSSIRRGWILKSLRLMLKLARMTSRSPFELGTRWPSISLR